MAERVSTETLKAELAAYGLHVTDIARDQGCVHQNVRQALYRPTTTPRYATRFRQSIRSVCWKNAAYAVQLANRAEEQFG